MNNKNSKRIVIVAVACTIIVACMMIAAQLNTRNNTEKSGEYTGVVCNVSTYTDYMTAYPSYAAVNFGDKLFEFSIDLSDVIVTRFDISHNYAKVAYTDSEDSYLMSIVIDQLDNDTREIKKNTIIDSIESTGDTNSIIEIAELNYQDKLYINVSHVVNNIDTVDSKESREIKLSDLGRHTDDYENTFALRMLNTILECAVYTDRQEETKTIIDIEGLGAFNIENLMDDEEYALEYADGCIAVYNTKYGELFRIKENTEEITAYTKEEWNNLYDISGSDNPESSTYRSFGVQTSKGCYIFQVGHDAPDEFEDKLIEKIGILPDDTKLDTQFNISSADEKLTNY